MRCVFVFGNRHSSGIGGQPANWTSKEIAIPTILIFIYYFE